MRDCMQYLPYMQKIDSTMFDTVLKLRQSYQSDIYTEKDVLKALSSDYTSVEELKILLSTEAENHIEALAKKAQNITKRYFGNNKGLFTPLYLSNHCNSKCVYCGFQKGNKIARAILDESEIRAEMKEISKSNLQEILLLTGEGREFASVEYIANACKIANEYFKVVGVEIYVLNVDEYELLHENGCDYVTVFQETYNPEKYQKIHISGEKTVMPYRFYAQERALMAGMRGVAFGALLGIDDFRKDALATALHAHFLQQKYPHAEISLSVPRLRPIINNSKISPKDVSEKRLLQVLCAYRIFLPFANIVISSRESKEFRDNIINIAATKMSAGVSVAIGEHSSEKKGDEQFEISDNRTVKEVFTMLKKSNFQPVMSDYVD